MVLKIKNSKSFVLKILNFWRKALKITFKATLKAKKLSERKFGGEGSSFNSASKKTSKYLAIIILDMENQAILPREVLF